MRKRTYKLLEKPPTNTKEKLIGDIWFAKVPYHEKGNWYKPRPVLIYDYIDNKYLCKKITTKPKGVPIELPKTHHTEMRQSYLTKYDIILEEDKFYFLVERNVDVEKYLKEI